MAWEPTFYWTGKSKIDAKLINDPHIKAEGKNEDRIEETHILLRKLHSFTSFDIRDVFNVQNYFLKANNWKGIIPGLRRHNVEFEDTPDWKRVEHSIQHYFPIRVVEKPTEQQKTYYEVWDKETLLQWYKAVQTIHPLSDLNGRTFGVIVAVLYHRMIEHGDDKVLLGHKGKEEDGLRWIPDMGNVLNGNGPKIEVFTNPNTDKSVYALKQVDKSLYQTIKITGSLKPVKYNGPIPANVAIHAEGLMRSDRTDENGHFISRATKTVEHISSVKKHNPNVKGFLINDEEGLGKKMMQSNLHNKIMKSSNYMWRVAMYGIDVADKMTRWDEIFDDQKVKTMKVDYLIMSQMPNDKT